MQETFSKPNKLVHEIALVGLGKMGHGIALQLQEKGWRVIAYNRSREKTDEIAKTGIVPAFTYKELIQKCESTQRIVWIMLPAGEAVEEAIFGDEGILTYLQPGDIVIDAGNSFYKDTMRRAETLAKKNIHFLDVGVSGGPAGARNGACLMIGGTKELFDYLEPLFTSVSIAKGYAHFEGSGAGHFVKMVHNGIEYGMMQALGEGFEVMKKSSYNLNLLEVSRIYNTGSVIESRLVEWLQEAYKTYGEELLAISGSVNSTGEGEWTVKTAAEMNIPVPIIKGSFDFRQQSKQNPSYTGQVVSALRGQFGGHTVEKNKN
ncbi:decarboxylating 6-phosphogluconate dehydrogenase [Candidatus Woesebacteria bacterium]|nr:decarboxylating 6-phosphogluconate dehydrogenase [Candidatus Woesebacteria bacterium]